jgi:hypothetical protein
MKRISCAALLLASSIATSQVPSLDYQLRLLPRDGRAGKDTH